MFWVTITTYLPPPKAGKGKRTDAIRWAEDLRAKLVPHAMHESTSSGPHSGLALPPPRGHHAERLRDLKARLDPANVFSSVQPIA